MPAQHATRKIQISRIHPDDYAVIKAAATAGRESVSSYARRKLLDAAAADGFTVAPTAEAQTDEPPETPPPAGRWFRRFRRSGSSDSIMLSEL